MVIMAAVSGLVGVLAGRGLDECLDEGAVRGLGAGITGVTQQALDESPGRLRALVAFRLALSPPTNPPTHHLCMVPLAMLSYMPMCV